MLILTRKSGESITLGPDIEITVIEINGEHVRIGITAPPSVTVLRKELLMEIREENLRASSALSRAALRLQQPVTLASTSETRPRSRKLTSIPSN